MGKDERSSAATQAHNLSSRQKEDRSRSACEVGEGEGCAEVGCLKVTEPAASMRQAFALEGPQRLHLATVTIQRANECYGVVILDDALLGVWQGLAQSGETGPVGTWSGSWVRHSKHRGSASRWFEG